MRRTPLLLLTASGEPEQELRALEAGADSCVRKDQEVGVILAMLAAILRSASAPAAMNVQQRLTQTKKVVFVAAPREHSSAIAAAVREEGYELGLAGSLAVARELIRTGGVDCLLIGSSVPQHDVVTVIREVKDSPLTRNTRIILVGESDAREELIHAISAGADHSAGQRI